MMRGLATGFTCGALMMTACVSHETHSRVLGELNEARQATLQSRQELDTYKKEAASAAAASEAERERLRRDARAELASLQSRLAEPSPKRASENKGFKGKSPR
jgi:hypothetical protein